MTARAFASTFFSGGAKGPVPLIASKAVSARVKATSAFAPPMSFMLSTDAVVDWALAAVPSFLFSSSARPAPYTMYTAPVPPVTMFSVLPVKLGAVLAEAGPLGAEVAGEVASGALHDAATRSATNGASTRTEVLI